MSNEAKVGAFVVVALAIFVATFISVANVQLGGERTTYKTYLHFAGGLESGNVVRFGGLRAGVVKDVRPWQEDPTRIEVLLEVRDNFPVNTESVAKVASLSALGDNYLEISPGQASASRIEPGGTIPSVETVTLDDITKKIFDVADTAQSLMKDMQRDFQRISDDAHVLLTNLQELSGEKNQRNIERMLENTNLLLEDLRPKLDNVTEDITATLDRAQRLAVEWEKVAKTADVAIGNLNGTIQDVRDPLQRDLEELEATLKQARALLDDVQALVAVNEDNINESIENFRVASQNIEELTDELRQRPWSLIRVKAKPDRQVPIPAGGR